MNTFIYSSESDYVALTRFRCECKMEKKPGIVLFKGKEYHLDNHGRFLGEILPICDEVRLMYATLILKD